MPRTRRRKFTFSISGLDVPSDLTVAMRGGHFATTRMLKMTIVDQNGLCGFYVLAIGEGRPFSFQLSGGGLPINISRLILFSGTKRILTSQLIFIKGPSALSLTIQASGRRCFPCSSVNVSFRIGSPRKRPTRALLSISIQSNQRRIRDERSVLASLLLVSRVGKCMHHPS